MLLCYNFPKLFYKRQTSTEVKDIYLAPLEGITDYIFRNTFRDFYGGIKKFYTPFLSPNATAKFPGRELKNIDPEINDVSCVIPQLLCANAEHFIWAMKEIKARGFKEVNLNLGCPSGTVTAKKKGSGFLNYPWELKDFLSQIYEVADKESMLISIKSRIGYLEEDEFPELLDIFNQFPISELTIHPRVRKDFYTGPIRMKAFDYAIKNTQNPLVYNGDIQSLQDIHDLHSHCLTVCGNDVSAIMIGRGIIEKPWILTGQAMDKEKLLEFHNSLLEQYTKDFSGDIPVINHMKEIWTYWSNNFPEKEKQLKMLKKTKSLAAYKASVADIFRN